MFIIITIMAVAGTVSYLALIEKPSEVGRQKNGVPTLTRLQTRTDVINPIAVSVSKSETDDWRIYSNVEIGFSFKYPKTGKIEGGLGTDICCLNLFNSVNSYQGEFLGKDVMKAQFQYHVDASISNKQQYLESLIKNSILELKKGSPISPIERSSIVGMQNENGIDILKFSGGVGNIGYIIPRNPDFSEVIYVIVWNPDSILEKVLATLKLTKEI